MDAERIGRRRNVEDPPRRNVYRQLDNTSSISSEHNDGANNQEVCQICFDSTPATSPFLRVEGALYFLQNTDSEYYGSYGYTIYGSHDLVL